MNFIDSVINNFTLQVKDIPEVSFYLPTKNGDQRKEIVELQKENNEKNILILSNTKNCNIKHCSGYNLVFINYKLQDKVFDRLSQETGLSDTQLLRAFVQSSSNCAIFLFLDDYLFYAEAIKIGKFLRKSLKSTVPIYVYILSPFINDILYMHLLFLNCDCRTPFIDTIYSRNNPKKMSEFIIYQKNLCDSLPSKENLNETVIITPEEYWHNNFYDYIPHDLKKVEHPEQDFEGMLKKYNQNFPPLRSEDKLIELSIDIIWDMEAYLILATLWKNFAKIIHYVKSVVNDSSLQSSYKTSLDLLKEETTSSSQYKSFFNIIEKYFHLVFEHPAREHCYLVPLNERNAETMQFSFYYYHIFCRLIAIFVYYLKHSLEREQKTKIAFKILEILKKGIGIFPIPVKINNEWKEINILDVFKHYRQNAL